MRVMPRPSMGGGLGINAPPADLKVLLCCCSIQLGLLQFANKNSMGGGLGINVPLADLKGQMHC